MLHSEVYTKVIIESLSFSLCKLVLYPSYIIVREIIPKIRKFEFVGLQRITLYVYIRK